MRVVRPISVSTSVEARPLEVFEFLAVLANHEQFLDHFLVDWEFSGPRPRGRRQGAGPAERARRAGPDRVRGASRSTTARRIVEDGLGAKDKHGTHRRHTRGTYTLTEASGGGTEVEFELEWLEASRAERMIPAMTRVFTRRSVAKGMRRLKKLLDRRD